MHAMKTIVMGILCIATAGAFGKTIYLKADATGDGSGDSWANACTDIATAVGKLETGSDERQIIYAAQGVYVVNATITAVKNFELYGGFKGDETGTEEEMLATRDWDAYQTILTGDKNGDDTWVHIVPDRNDLSKPQYVPTDEPVIKDGKVNLPAYTGDYDAYVLAKPTAGTYTTECFYLQPLCGTVILDGVWATSFAGGSGTFVRDGQSFNGVTAKLYIRNCRMVGHRSASGSGYSGFYYGYAKRTLNEVSNCIVQNCSQQGPAPMYGGVQVKDCSFIGITAMSWDSTTGTGGSRLGFYNWNGGEVDRCSYARCIIFSSTEGPFIDGADAVGFSCTNNFFVSSAANGCPFMLLNNRYASNSCFRANFMANTGLKAGKSYAFLLVKNGGDWNASGCGYTTFEENEIVAKLAAAPGEGSYTMGLVSHSYDSQRPLMVYGCSFLKNKVSVESTEAVTGYACDAVVQAGITVVSRPDELAMAGCTVYSRGDAGVYSLVQIGENIQSDFEVVNCLFMSEADRPEPFFLLPGKEGYVKFRCCSVKNVPAAPSGAYAIGWTSDEVPFERCTALCGDVLQSFYRIAALPPDVGVACDVYPYCRFYDRKSRGALNYKYREPGVSDWTRLSPVYAKYGGDSNGAPSIPVAPAKDVTGEASPFGAYNRGAIQQPTELALTGKTLTLRRDPLTGGTFTGPAVQAVAAGTAPQQVTVVPAAGRSFDGWYDENGDKVSDQTTLTIAALDDDLVLTARFAAPKVKLTFELGDYATYVEGGSHTYEVELQPGAVFSAQDIPNYAANEGWHLLGWDKSLPQQVPDEATTWTMTAVTKDLRRIYLVPPEDAPETQDGTSWASAYTSLSVAYADAAKYRGEVWVKKGEYVVSSQIVPRSNVSVYGGFEGTEDEREAADPAAHITSIVGATSYLFYNAESLVTNAVYSGVVISNFTAAAFSYASSLKSDLKFRNCVFAKNGVALSLKNVVLDVFGCRFVGNGRALNDAMDAAYAADGEKCVFDGCVIERNRGSNVSAGLTLSGSMCVLVTNCVFEGNVSVGDYAHNAAGSSALTITANLADEMNTVADCVFKTNSVSYNGLYTLYLTGRAVVGRCLFDGNKASASCAIVSYQGGPRTAGICASGTDILVRDCVFTNQLVNADVVPADEVNRGYQNANVTWSAIAVAESGRLTLLNCSAEDTRVACIPDEIKYASAVAIGAVVRHAGANLALVNCRISGSTITDGYSSQVAVRGGSGAFVAINTIIDAPDVADGGVAWWKDSVANNYAGIANSYLADLPDGFFVTDAGNAYSFDPVTEEPHYDPVKRVDPTTGFAMPVVKGPAPYLRGRGVYLKDNAVWFRDTVTNPEKPWRKAVDRNAFEADGSAAAPSRADGQVADAFGAPRRGRHCTLGPLVGPPIGLMLMVR